MANYKGHIAGGLAFGVIVAGGSYAIQAGGLPDGGVLLQDCQ